MGKSGPSQVERAKDAIIHYGLTNQCIVHSSVQKKLTRDENYSSKFSKTIFGMAWKELRDAKKIVLIGEKEQNFSKCKLENSGAKLFYKLNSENQPDLYLNMGNIIEGIRSPDKAFSFIEQLKSAFAKLYELAYWEDLVEKFMVQTSALEFENDDYLTFHFRFLESIHDLVYNAEAELSSNTLQRFQEEILSLLPKVTNGSCNTISALGVVALAFSLIWKSNREMGRMEFISLVEKAVESLNATKEKDDLENVKRYFSLLQCYSHSCRNYKEYFDGNERKDFLIRLQTCYFSLPIMVDANLKMRIEYVLNWFMERL